MESRVPLVNVNRIMAESFQSLSDFLPGDSLFDFWIDNSPQSFASLSGVLVFCEQEPDVQNALSVVPSLVKGQFRLKEVVLDCSLIVNVLDV